MKKRNLLLAAAMLICLAGCFCRAHVIGHEEYSPRKKDPGELFEWSRILP